MASNIDSMLKLTSSELSTLIVTKTDTFIELYIEVVPRFLTLLARDVKWEPNEINKALAIWSGEIELISCNHRYEQGSLYFDFSAPPFTEDLRMAAERYLDAAIQVWSVLRDHVVQRVRYDV